MAERLPRVVIVGGGFGGLAAGGDRRPDARADYIPIVVTEAAQVCQVLRRRAPA